MRGKLKIMCKVEVKKEMEYMLEFFLLTWTQGFRAICMFLVFISCDACFLFFSSGFKKKIQQIISIPISYTINM